MSNITNQNLFENTKGVYFKINLDDLDENREIRGLR